MIAARPWLETRPIMPSPAANVVRHLAACLLAPSVAVLQVPLGRSLWGRSRSARTPFPSFRRQIGRASSALAFFAASLAATLFCGAAFAEPRFAVREGLACSACHVNRTGGGMRTPFGVAWAQTHLSTWRAPGVSDPRLGERITIGANLRMDERSVLPANTQLDGARYHAPPSSSFENSAGTLYLRADAIPEHLAVYIDETVAPEGASNREAFVLLHGLPLSGYVKAGRFFLPYGLRIQDDTAFMRQQTGYTFANQDLGVEIGIAPHPFMASFAVSNGTLGGADTNLPKQFTGQVGVVAPWGRLSASLAYNDTSVPAFPFKTLTAGLHGGLRFGRLGLLGSLDWIHGFVQPTAFDQYALFTEADFEAWQGVHFRGRFESFDPSFQIKENERDRFVLGGGWFPIQWLELRSEFRINRDIPQRVAGNANEILVQIHGFF